MLRGFLISKLRILFNSVTIDYYIYGLETDDVTVLLIGDYSVTRMSFVFKFEALVF